MRGVVDLRAKTGLVSEDDDAERRRRLCEDLAKRIKIPDLHEKQREMMERAKPYRFNVACCGRRWGKSFSMYETLLRGVHEKGALYGRHVAVFSPTIDTTRSAYRELARITAPITIKKTQVPREILLGGGGSISFFSLNNPDTGRGANYSTIVVDEAAMILHLEEAWQQTLRMMLADTRGVSWFLSTPKGENYFSTLYGFGDSNNIKRDPLWLSHRYPSYSNPTLPEGEVAALTKDMPELEKLQEVEAQFVNFAGTLVRAANIHRGQMPRLVNVVMAVDLAIGLKTTNDYSAIVIMGRADDGKIWIADTIRGRWTFAQIKEQIKRAAYRWRPESVGIETVQAQAWVYQELLAETNLPLVRIDPNKDKVTRFGPLAARFGQDLIWFNEQTVTLDFEREVLAFPEGKNDDMVDASSHAYALLPDAGSSQIIFAAGSPPPEAPAPSGPQSAITAAIREQTPATLGPREGATAPDVIQDDNGAPLSDPYHVVPERAQERLCGNCSNFDERPGAHWCFAHKRHVMADFPECTEFTLWEPEHAV